jgi:hypothetical protein
MTERLATVIEAPVHALHGFAAGVKRRAGAALIADGRRADRRRRSWMRCAFARRAAPSSIICVITPAAARARRI